MATKITPVSTEQETNPPPSDSHHQEIKTKGEELTAGGKDQKAHPSPSNQPPVVFDEEANRRSLSLQYLRNRRCLLCCSGCCGATVLLVGFLLLILSFTVLKVKDPTLTMNGIYIDGVDITAFDSWAHPIAFNATLTVDISLKNPNVASFAYDSSTTKFYYHGHIVGVAYVPDGRVGADRTARTNATLDVMVDRIAETNATDSVAEGKALGLTSFTDICGRVNVAGIYKRDIEVMLNCSMSLDPSSQAQMIKNQRCVANVR